MSTVKTYLVLVWSYALAMAHDMHDIANVGLGIQVGEVHSEIHALLQLTVPLTPKQMQGLTRMKADGLFSSFSVRDEITPGDNFEEQA